MQDAETSPSRRTLALVSLVLAGEAIFIPAFHLGRYFKSSMLSALRIDELQLGQLGAIYGFVAMGCYLVGGPLADRFSPRKLIAGSLLVTALGGLYMTTLPGMAGLLCLYAFWGASTILAFWAPLIRATREWGGAAAQGRAFGLLDGGRGLASALIAALAAYGFSLWFDSAGVVSGVQQDIAAVRSLMFFYTLCCVAAAAAVWACVPDPPRSETLAETTPGTSERSLAVAWRNTRRIATMPAVWLQALVILSAYTAFKSIDYFGLYCEDAYGVSKSTAAAVVSWLSFLRAGAAVAAGWVADRWLGVAGTIAACFAALAASFAAFVMLPTDSGWFTLAVANMAVACSAFFALRGVYFALLQEEGVPRELTGTAVGLVSLLGFLPEIYFPLASGWLIRSAREAGDVLTGYDRLFAWLAITAAVGLAAAWALRPKRRGS